MRRAFLIGVPYAWLLALFLVPFAIVFKISLSDIAIAIPPYTPTLEDGLAEMLAAFDFENFVFLTQDDLYWKAYLSSLWIALMATALTLLVGYPMAYAMARAPEEWRPTLMNEGTVLGLAIVQRLVDLMGGYVWVESEDGVGSCFGVQLQLPVSEYPDDPPNLPDDLPPVLLVDASELNRDILSKQLTQMGLDVVTACTGSGALDLLQHQSRFSAAVLAQDLPDMTTEDWTEGARRLEAAMPVLLSSNEPSLQHGAYDGILPRPVTRAVLFEKLKILGGQIDPDHVTPKESVRSGARRMRILAAEDNKTNRLVLSKMLKSLNAELHFAENGEEAIAAYSKVQPDMIFMDISMPILDGKSATRRIRDLEAEGATHTPIIALTAHVLESDQDEIMQSGIDVCLTKPLRKDKILEQVHLHHPGDAMPLENV